MNIPSDRENELARALVKIKQELIEAYIYLDREQPNTAAALRRISDAFAIIDKEI